MEEIVKENNENVANAEKKKNPILDFISKNIVKIAIIMCAITAVVGPIFFAIITSFKKAVESNGTLKYKLVYEKEYIVSVCIVTLIILGILFILCITTLIYHFIKNKEMKKA